MATLSLTTPKTNAHNRRSFRREIPPYTSPAARRPIFRPFCALPRIPSTPPTAPPGELYQPFRPPPSPLPSHYRSLGLSERLDILRNRLGLWYEYAPLISSLSRDGFTPPSIEEITGITGAEQNRLAVASQVRDSLIPPSFAFPPDLLPFFEAPSSANLLYELRLLNASQRVAASLYIIERRLDAKEARELARAMKDFPKRRGEEGWKSFSAASPGDCLAYADFRLSREVMEEGERVAALERAMVAVETEEAKRTIEDEMAGGKKVGETEGEEQDAVPVPVVRLRYGEVADATSVVVLPVCLAAEGEEGVEAAPGWCRGEGEMGVVVAERGWRRWVVLPGWGPAAAVWERGGVVVEFGDGRVLPWRMRQREVEEGVLVVVDKAKKEVAEEGYYLVGGGGGGRVLGVERGRKLLEMGKKKALGGVVLVVRPPKEDEDYQLRDEDWE
ncbi:hypothetical protein HPP92_025973 [Vanilla planifolia]|uniref:Uncharacterized protein n=1 Tax=Vanilla planifolia TaxID=51239 RepID=A0A835U890_VANPL|nr:hypothetical protein HPP92_025973 [Vanilla planifolia]